MGNAISLTQDYNKYLPSEYSKIKGTVGTVEITWAPYSCYCINRHEFSIFRGQKNVGNIKQIISQNYDL